VTGIVALRPERVTSDLSISWTSPVRSFRYVSTASRYSRASGARPRQDVDIERLTALPNGVTTRSGWVRMVSKLSTEPWVVRMSWNAWVGSSWLRSFFGYAEARGTLVVARGSGFTSAAATSSCGCV